MQTTTTGNDLIRTLGNDELDAVSGGAPNRMTIDLGFIRIHYNDIGDPDPYVCSGTGVSNTHCTG
jgi:hypothetical protein